VLVRVHHAANPKFSLSGNEKQLVAGHTRPINVLAPEQTALVIKDRFACVNLLPAAFSFDHRINETFEFFARPAVDAKPVQRIGMNEANFSRYSTRQTSLEDSLRFGQGIRTNHSSDMQADF
jgi:hypothetical protein